MQKAADDHQKKKGKGHLRRGQRSGVIKRDFKDGDYRGWKRDSSSTITPREARLGRRKASNQLTKSIGSSRRVTCTKRGLVVMCHHSVEC